MKRYFIFPEAKEVVTINFESNSVVRKMDTSELFKGCKDVVVEVGKNQAIAAMAKYRRENETNLTMTITR